RAHLQKKARQADPHAGLQRIRATLGQKNESPPHRFLSRLNSRRGWLTAAAAVVVAGLLGRFFLGSAGASENALVPQALQVHSQPVDRCYLVEIKREAEFLEKHPLWAAIRQTRLWTRGDRFWIDSGAGVRQWSWGRDREGRLWLTLSANRGLRFES